MNFNLLKFYLGLEDVKSKKAMIQAEIDVEEEEQHNLEREIKKLHYKLAQVTDSLNKKILIRNEYNRIITDTEAHYMKVTIFNYIDNSRRLSLFLISKLFKGHN